MYVCVAAADSKVYRGVCLLGSKSVTFLGVWEEDCPSRFWYKFKEAREEKTIYGGCLSKGGTEGTGIRRGEVSRKDGTVGRVEKFGGGGLLCKERKFGKQDPEYTGVHDRRNRLELLLQKRHGRGTFGNNRQYSKTDRCM